MSGRNGSNERRPFSSPRTKGQIPENLVKARQRVRDSSQECKVAPVIPLERQRERGSPKREREEAPQQVQLETRERRRPDFNNAAFYLTGVVTILVLFGVIMIYSSSSNLGFLKYNSSLYFVKRQLIAAGIGFALMLGLARRDYHKLVRLSHLFCIVGGALLIMVFIPSLGVTAYGSRRFIRLGIQPSELAKIALVLYAAYHLTRKGAKVEELRDLIVPTALVTLIYVALILKEPDMGTAAIISATVLAMMVAAGGRWKHILSISLIAVMGAICFALFSPYRLQRVTSLLNPWADAQGSGFHLVQSFLALGSGKIYGLGLGMSRQKFMYLPNAHNDFIFSIIGEELGFIGTMFVVIAFMTFIVVGIKIARRAPDNLGRVLALGITFLIGAQAFVNMGAVTGILPVTGVTLPFVSYGGSSLVIFMASVGILVNVAIKGKVVTKRIPSRREIDARGDMRRRDRGASAPPSRVGRRAGIA